VRTGYKEYSCIWNDICIVEGPGQIRSQSLKLLANASWAQQNLNPYSAIRDCQFQDMDPSRDL
jgi:hypothetical protein